MQNLISDYTVTCSTFRNDHACFIVFIIINMLTFIMRLLLQNRNIGAVQNTNSGRLTQK